MIGRKSKYGKGKYPIYAPHINIETGKSIFDTDVNEEFDRCKSDPYYFYINYVLVDGQEPKMTRDEFNSKLNIL